MKNKNILSETDRLFDIAVERLGLDTDLSRVLKTPYREVKVEIPVRDSDGQLHIYNGYRIQHNGARGPYYGGIALASDIDLKSIISLASRTVWKTALMNVPFGGAYGAININTKDLSLDVINNSLRNYTHKISTLIGPYKDILTQGKNADEVSMACIMDEYSKKHVYSPAVATGKPETLSGTLGRKTALVSSSYYLLDLVSKNLQTQIHGNSLALSVDVNLAAGFIEYLNYIGCNLVAISDGVGAIYNQNGFNMEELKTYIIQNKKVSGYHESENIEVSSIAAVDCDILLLGCDSTLINTDNASDVKASIVLEMDDALISYDAEPILYDNNVTVVPDLLVSSGEVIVDYFEWIQNIQQFRWDYDQINEEMAKYMNDSFRLVTDLTVEHGVNYRLACYMAGISRVAEATKLRGYI